MFLILESKLAFSSYLRGRPSFVTIIFVVEVVVSELRLVRLGIP